MLRQVIKSLPITVSSLTLIRSSLIFAASLVQTHLVLGVSLVLLEGTSHNRGTSHDPGTLYVRSLRRLKPEESGIYTYRTPNEAGNIIDFNVGLYSTNKTSTIFVSNCLYDSFTQSHLHYFQVFLSAVIWLVHSLILFHLSSPVLPLSLHLLKSSGRRMVIGLTSWRTLPSIPSPRH